MKIRLLVASVFAVYCTALTAAAPSASAVADAAMKGDRDGVRALLKQGADVGAAHGDGMTALHWAAERGDVELAEMLLYAGANVGAVTRIGHYTPLHLASQMGNAPVVQALLKGGANVAAKTTTTGVTPLHLAAASGNPTVVKLLLDRGADVNVRDTFYNATPLTWAVSPQMGRKPQHPEIVRLLVAKGATGKGPALIGAVSAGDAATTKVLLEAGDYPADGLSDALEAATRSKRQEIVALLEAAGAKPRVEYKMDEAQLARYAGTYLGPGNTELVLTVAAGRLTGSAAPGQRLTFISRDATTFGAAEAAGVTLTIRLEGDKVTSVGFPSNATTWTRVEGK
jgi:ankyrin repeat protein